MPHTLSYSESTSSFPDLEFSPSRKNVFYIPIPPSGEIVFQSLTREQKRLLRNMGKPSPKQIFDESPPPTPEKRTFRRYSLVLSPVLPVSEDSDNPAYEMSPKVRESTEKVRLYKERLVAMRASRSLGSTSASVSSVTGSDVNTEKVVKASDNNSMRFEYPGVNESEDAHIQVCEAAHMPVMVGEGENKDGAWEPLCSGADEGRPFGLEGLGISVWTENTYNTGKLFKNDCSEGNFTVGSATERDEPTSGEVATTSADAVTLSTAPDIHQSHSCCNLLDVDCLMDFRVHEAAITPVPVKISDREDGIWEPIFSGSSKDKSLGLEGLGISIWIGSTHSVEKLAQGSCSDDVVAINTAVGSEGSDVWEDIALSDDGGKFSSFFDTYWT